MPFDASVHVHVPPLPDCCVKVPSELIVTSPPMNQIHLPTIASQEAEWAELEQAKPAIMKRATEVKDPALANPHLLRGFTSSIALTHRMGRSSYNASKKPFPIAPFNSFASVENCVSPFVDILPTRPAAPIARQGAVPLRRN